jgi:hypothetical protein
MGLFKVGWPGERMMFGPLCEEFERSHFAGLAENRGGNHRSYINNLRLFFGDRKLDYITPAMVYAQNTKSRPLRRKLDGGPLNCGVVLVRPTRHIL